jgi:hypothetical protein
VLLKNLSASPSEHLLRASHIKLACQKRSRVIFVATERECQRRRLQQTCKFLQFGSFPHLVRHRTAMTPNGAKGALWRFVENVIIVYTPYKSNLEWEDRAS